MDNFLPLGLRLNNPGNIRLSTIVWQGMAQEQLDPHFVTFNDPVYGIRAMAKILAAYEARGICTIEGIVSTWAPAADGNNIAAYVQDVCHRCNVGPDELLSVMGFLPHLIEAIIWHEQGQQPYTDDQIQQGIKLATL